MSEIIVVADKLGSGFHGMPEAWLRARVRGWMEMIESPGEAFWIGSHTTEGKWIFCSSNNDTWLPGPNKQAFAIKVVQHLNRECSEGGAWLAGWIRGGEFYLLWKDPDGDIQCPLEFPQPPSALARWAMTDFQQLASKAILVTKSYSREVDTTANQRVKLAQGQKPSAAHAVEGSKYVVHK